MKRAWIGEKDHPENDHRENDRWVAFRAETMSEMLLHNRALIFIANLRKEQSGTGQSSPSEHVGELKFGASRLDSYRRSY